MFTARFNFLCLGIAVLLATHVVAQTPSKNSTEKRRPTPSPLAAKVGSAINWQTSFANARKLSEQTGKPIFWYVPTLENSFMDRIVEIDRYMQAGLFSWPRLIKLINEDFVPLRAVPKPAEAQSHSLVPFQFVEPGFVVIDAKGQTSLRCDRLTTQHPIWFEALLASVPGRPNAGVVRLADNRPLGMAWKLFGNAQYRQCLGYAEMMAAGGPFAQEPSAEQELLRGMCQFRVGDQTAAKNTWAAASTRFPNDPLAWKAAAEAEGLGPFVRGFEVLRHLPASAYDQLDLTKVSSAAPPATYPSKELWRRGVHFLLGMQRSDGGFVDCDYDFGGADSLPNIHVAITAICGMALLEADARKVKVQQRQRHNAVELARQFVLNDANWNVDDSDELFWAHAYRVRFLVASIKHGWEGKATLQAAVKGLQSMQLASGSWFHEYPNPMVTALALVALKEAEDVGATIDQPRVAKAIESLSGNRGKGGFFYMDATGADPEVRDQDQTDASAGRLPLCELALHRWNATDNKALANAVRVSFDKQSHLLAALKYDDHTSRHAYGGFFFWFDLVGRTDAIAALENQWQQTQYQEQIRDLILTLPELDGCFVDSHEIGRCYGTAMALLCLAQADLN